MSVSRGRGRRNEESRPARVYQASARRGLRVGGVLASPARFVSSNRSWHAVVRGEDGPREIAGSVMIVLGIGVGGVVGLGGGLGLGW